MCLNENEFKRNIDHHEQIFIVMPPKAGGSSLIGFARMCCGDAAVFQNQLHVPTLRKQWLTEFYDTPNLHIGHILGEGMKSLLKGVSKDSLIVYIHREETSRVASAVKHVMSVFCTGDIYFPARKAPFSFVQRNETDHTCTIEENDLVDKVIQRKVWEIKNSVHDIWSCDTFNTLNDNRPNLIVMNMNQIDTLQKMLAERFFPQMANKPALHRNVGTEKKTKNFVQLSSNSTRIVSLDEWVLKKKNMIEYTLGLKEDIGCQNNVRDMEDKLFETCSDDGFLNFLFV